MAITDLNDAIYNSQLHRITDTFNSGVANNELSYQGQQHDYQSQLDQLATQRAQGREHQMASLGARGLASGVTPGYLANGAYNSPYAAYLNAASGHRERNLPAEAAGGGGVYGQARNQYEQGYDYQQNSLNYAKGLSKFNYANNLNQLTAAKLHGVMDTNAMRQAANSMPKSPYI